MTTYLKPIQVEAKTGYKTKTLANWRSITRATGILTGPPAVQIGRSIRYIEEDVDEWLRAQASPVHETGPVAAGPESRKEI